MAKMRVTQVVGLVLGALLAMATFAAVAAQGYGGTLPAGVTGATIDGNTTNSNTSPNVSNTQPKVGGKLSQAGGTVTIQVQPGNITFNAPVGPDGSFSATLPSTLAPGAYTVYFNE